MRFLVIALLLSACATQQPVPISEAGVQVIDSFAAMRAEAAKVGRAGMVPCTAEITLNLQSTNGATLSTGLPEGAKLGASASATTGSVMQITLKSPECGAQLAPGEQPMLLRH